MDQGTDTRQSTLIKAMRFPLIVLVVFAHSVGTYPSPTVEWSLDGWNIFHFVSEMLSRHLFSIGTCWFFVFSGYLFLRYLKEEEFGFQWVTAKWKKRFWSLLVPYLLWNLFAVFAIASKNFLFRLFGTRSDSGWTIVLVFHWACRLSFMVHARSDALDFDCTIDVSCFQKIQVAFSRCIVYYISFSVESFHSYHAFNILLLHRSMVRIFQDQSDHYLRQGKGSCSNSCGSTFICSDITNWTATTYIAPSFVLSVRNDFLYEHMQFDDRQRTFERPSVPTLCQCVLYLCRTRNLYSRMDERALSPDIWRLACRDLEQLLDCSDHRTNRMHDPLLYRRQIHASYTCICMWRQEQEIV